jgi:hypothetical protein
MHFTKFERAILECVDASRGMPRHCAKHEFRAINAEEGAAAAIFSSLRQLGHARAKSLSFNSHAHKQAVYPFPRAVDSVLADAATRKATKGGDSMSIDGRTEDIDVAT